MNIFTKQFRSVVDRVAGAAWSWGFWVESEPFFCPAPAPTRTPTTL